MQAISLQSSRQLFDRATRTGFLRLALESDKHQSAVAGLLRASAEFFSLPASRKQTAATTSSSRGYYQYLSAASNSFEVEERIEAFNLENPRATQFELRAAYFAEAGWADATGKSKPRLRPNSPLLRMYPSILDQQRWPCSSNDPKTGEEDAAFKEAFYSGFDHLQEVGESVVVALLKDSFLRLQDALASKGKAAADPALLSEALSAIRAGHNAADSTLEAKYYPRLQLSVPSSSSSSSIVRVQPHTDLSTVTLLFQTGVKGISLLDLDLGLDETTSSSSNGNGNGSFDAGSTLEMMAPGDHGPLFLAIKSRPYEAVVNTGDFFRAWSGDVFPSTIHRVSGSVAARSTLPKKTSGNDDGSNIGSGATALDGRISIAFFYRPNWSAQVETLRLFQALKEAGEGLPAAGRDGGGVLGNMKTPFAAGDAMPMA